MKRHAACFGFCLLLLAVTFVPRDSGVASAQDGQQLSLEQRVDRVFARFDRPDSPGAAVAVVKDGEILYQNGYGMAHLESRTPITPHTVFHMASVSKQFPAFAMHLLAADGKLSLDDPVRQHVPELHDFGPTITIRHLIHHISGIRDQWSLLTLAGWRMEDVITEQDIMRLLERQRELNFEPGAEYLYSNSGYTLLARIVRSASGQTLREFCEERIFQPLGMTNTHFHDDHREVVPNRAYSYTPSGGGFQYRVLSYATVGATSLFTTVGDMAKWSHNFDEPTVGTPELIEAVQQRGRLNNGRQISYAHGLQIGTHRGLRTVGHGGSDAGYRTQFLRYPEQRLAVIVLSNVSNGNPGGLAREVAELYLDDVMDPPTGAGEEEIFPDPWQDEALTGSSQGGGQQQQQRPPLTREQMDEYAGTYFSEELRAIYTIERRGNRLVVDRMKGAANMNPTGEDRFSGGPGTTVFERNGDGEVTGFRVSTGRVRNLLFRKTEFRFVDER